LKERTGLRHAQPERAKGHKQSSSRHARCESGVDRDAVVGVQRLGQRLDGVARRTEHGFGCIGLAQAQSQLGERADAARVVGVGEGIDDLEPFEAEDFASAIAGIAR